jgi:hypothetical protein
MDVIELIKKDLQNKKDPMIDTLVVLKKDDRGYYIEYAFKDGAPHDNRCLSWYDSYQEEAYINNGWVSGLTEEAARKRLDNIRLAREKRIGMVFRLSSFSCGHEEDPEGSNARQKEYWEKYHPGEEYVPEDHVCRPGCPAKACQWVKNRIHPWSYESPVKCACWVLKDGQTMEDYINNYQISMSASELAELL